MLRRNRNLSRLDVLCRRRLLQFLLARFAMFVRGHRKFAFSNLKPGSCKKRTRQNCCAVRTFSDFAYRVRQHVLGSHIFIFGLNLSQFVPLAPVFIGSLCCR